MAEAFPVFQFRLSNKQIIKKSLKKLLQKIKHVLFFLLITLIQLLPVIQQFLFVFVMQPLDILGLISMLE